MKKVFSLIIISGFLFFCARGLFASYIPLKGGGNIGIGTTAPGALLDVGKGTRTNIDGVNDLLVAGDLEVDGAIYGTLASGSETDPTLTNDGGVTLGDGSSNTTSLTFNADSGTDGALVWDGINDDFSVMTGKIGIGTTSPKNLLDVSGGVAIGTSYSGTYTAPTNGLLVQGNVGIGTTNPSQQLELTRSLRMPATTSSTTGVIYKGANRFMHDYTASGTTGVNTFIGTNAGNFTMAFDSAAYDASYNTAVGYGALSSLTYGYVNGAFGYNALNANTIGNANSAFGAYALSKNTIGNGHIAFGYYAASENISGNYNHAVGQEALRYNTTGSSNTALGYQAGMGAVTSSDISNNTLIGYLAGTAILTGANNNILIGYRAGDAITTGATNILIGYDIDAQAVTDSNKLSLGNLIFGSGINGTGTTVSTGNIGIGTTSPQNKLDVEGGSAIGAIYSGSYAAPGNGLIVQGNVGVGTTVTVSALDARGDEARIWTGAGTNSNATASGELYVEGDLEVDGTIYGTLSSTSETDPTLTNDGGVTIGAAGNTVTLTFDGGTTDGVLTWDDINDDFSTTSGNVGIGTTSPLSVLAVSGGVAIGSSFSGTYGAPANGLIVQGNVGIGMTKPTLGGLNIFRDTEDGLYIDIANSSANQNPLIRTRKYRGTIASPTVVANSDSVFEILSRGYDGSANRNAGTILLEVDGTPGASDMPGRWLFSTTPDGSATEQTRMTIKNNGNVGIGVTVPIGLLDVRGDEARIWTGAGTNTNATASGELYVEGDLEVDGTIYGTVSGGGLVNPLTADLDTGGFMIESNAGILRFDPDDDATAEVVFDSSGNVGVGVTAPAFQLEVGGGNVHFQNSSLGAGLFWKASSSRLGIGTTAVAGINSDSRIHIIGNGDEAITIETSSGTLGPIFELKHNAGDGGRHYQILSTGSGNSIGAGRFGIYDTTGSAWRIVMDSAGNVGIGTTFPKNVLDVEGSVAIGTSFSGSYAAPANGLIVQGYVAIGTTGVVVAAGETGVVSIVSTSDISLALGAPDFLNKTINFYDSTSGETWQWAHRPNTEANRLEAWYYNGASWAADPALSLSTGGNVGIGNTAIVTNLHIRGTGTPGIRLGNTAGNGDVTLDMMESDATGDGVRWLYNGTTNRLTFQEYGGADIMTILRSGNVGIGTTGPRQKLEVNGDIRTDFNGTATTNGVCHSGADVDAAPATDRDLVVCNNSAGDIAEWYDTTGTEPGDIVAVTGRTITYESPVVNAMTGEVLNEKHLMTVSVLEKTGRPYQMTAIGIISTSPVRTFGRGVMKKAQAPNPLALIGRVPVKVSLENGPVQIGDFITTSSAPGVGMKATGPGRVVGMALEPLKALPEDAKGYARIMVFVNPHWGGEGETVFPVPDSRLRDRLRELTVENQALRETYAEFEKRVRAVEEKMR